MSAQTYLVAKAARDLEQPKKRKGALVPAASAGGLAAGAGGLAYSGKRDLKNYRREWDEGTRQLKLSSRASSGMFHHGNIADNAAEAAREERKYIASFKDPKTVGTKRLNQHLAEEKFHRKAEDALRWSSIKHNSRSIGATERAMKLRMLGESKYALGGAAALGAAAAGGLALKRGIQNRRR